MAEMPDNWQNAAIALGVVVAVAFVVSQIVARLLRQLLVRATGAADDTSLRSPIQRRPIRLLQVAMFLVLAAALTPPALKTAGVELAYGLEVETLTAWALADGLRILLIAVLAYFGVRVASLAISHFEAIVALRAGEDLDRRELIDRVRTVGGLIRNAVNVVLISAALLMILQEIGVNITPLLTGAGIAGLAVGFGAQHLVRDIISGFFLILEDQVHVGDVVKVNGTGGLVEALKLRTITLRDLSGTVHVFPNGSINELANLTKDFSFAVIDVGVAYKEDTDVVSDVLRGVGAELRQDPAFGPLILDALEVLGVDDFGESEVTIKIRIKTLPLQQWSVGRELRRRIKKAFDARGIEIPFPHRSIYVGEASKPWVFEQRPTPDRPPPT